MQNYHNLSVKQTLTQLKSSEKGLSSIEASERLTTSASKQIVEVRKKSLFEKFAEQFKDLMILILLVASTISMIIGIVQKTSGEIIDGCIILAIVIMNSIFGVVQENKAEKALDSLKKMIEPEASVLRDGEIIKINSKKIVEGDVVLLEAGTIVPADVRILSSSSLIIDESSLTGESHAIEKNSDNIYPNDTPLADRRNMAYKGSTVVAGRGYGVVVAIGKETELGKIANAISTTEKEMTPLQKNIKSIGKILTFLVLSIAAITFVLEMVARPEQPLQAFLTAVAISVAAIPESMPAVITIIVSLGIARLAKQKAIVKRMHAVETLGSCDVICSDKTGTITENKMSVVSAYCDGIMQNGKIKPSKSFDYFMASMVLCNNTSISHSKFVGAPTEVALSNFAKNLKINKLEFEKLYPRIDEKPFDSKRKLMSTINSYQGKKVMFTKGATDFLLKKCNSIIINGQVHPLSEKYKLDILNANKDMASRALRVLGVAYKNLISTQDNNEDNLTFVGLVGMIDPPRREIKNAVKKCRRAGMRPIMITGDHKDTAFAIAKQIGIVESSEQVLTGTEIDAMSKAEFEKAVEKVNVFARVSPENKVQIVEMLKKNGHVVAMTGDGVNDAPALKKAEIGIGMGITGTDVTKEVSDMIVTDDNFATIVVAVEEGRKIYTNIQKTVKFLFSANMGELLSLFIATLIFPNCVFLFPVQILFTNLITDSLPAIALGLEPPENNLMDVKPRNVKKSMFAGGMGVSVVVLGIVQTILTIVSYYIGLRFSEQVAITMAFYTLNIIQMFYLASMRTNRSIFKSNPLKNKMFIISLVFCFGLIALFAFTPLRVVLSLAPLSLWQWGIIFGLSILMMIASELFKLGQYLVQKMRFKRG